MTKNAWKVYFFHRKARNACDVLRVSKTVFLEEKGTFEICLSHEKGTMFSIIWVHLQFILSPYTLNKFQEANFN